MHLLKRRQKTHRCVHHQKATPKISAIKNPAQGWASLQIFEVSG